MSFDISLWQRIEHRSCALYLRPDQPAWFVPNRAGDQLLQQLNSREADLDSPRVQRFLNRLPDAVVPPYPGRGTLLATDHLHELWLHITNRCNLSCRHCLFTSGPNSDDELPGEEIIRRVDEASALGCRVFALTGGEPFVHPQFDTIVRHILADPSHHVAVLTNGMTLSRQLAEVDWDRQRFHLQISVDGLPERHDSLRGAGMFARLQQQLDWLRQHQFPFTLSMCVEQDNVADMAAVVDLAADCGAGNVHFMWYFVRGRGEAEQVPSVDRLYHHLCEAIERAEQRGVSIDNLDALKTQVFAPAGTIHDGSGSGWESVAIGPDGHLYPSAALVGVEALKTPLNGSLQQVWQHSAVLESVRNSSCRQWDSPWRYLLGGGDIDHSFIHGGTFVGNDPYLPLYEKMALDLIVAAAQRLPEHDHPGLRLKMGDLLESCGAHGKVALLHSNCLLSLTHEDSRSVVKNFYSEAVGDKNEDILNPVCYEPAMIDHITPAYRFRGYGCGSPVLDADIQGGETILDLGCGSGVECFIAARFAGRKGRVIGVDMLDPMLELARKGAVGVAKNLGFDTLDFRKGYLEQLPVESNSVDLILSNCVLNLSADKRLLFREIFRVLKPGGRLVVADVVCEQEPDAAIRNDEVLRGECIAGALTQKDLVGLLNESGFEGVMCDKRVPYRRVQDHPFFSLTFSARKPERDQSLVRVMYPGPFPSIRLPDGRILVPGQIDEVPLSLARSAGAQLYQLDDAGHVTNLTFTMSCNCAISPEVSADGEEDSPIIRQQSGCMVCGAPLDYDRVFSRQQCCFCGRHFEASECCEQGHYVCDACHSQDALAVIETMCRHSRETDMLALFSQLRQHPSVPLHGPEYHALVPAVILTCYRNIGGKLGDSLLNAALSRGSQVIGGSCAYSGVCGAAIGVGIAFSLILEANPLKADQRQVVQNVVQQVLKELAQFKAARCCNRDGVVSLQKAAELSADFLPVPLRAEQWLPCDQHVRNKECLGAQCPLF
jgi:MoaA/NifB/PqqE/SkfB family radical SAM enzyme/SAM-dependent methyltransferase